MTDVDDKAEAPSTAETRPLQCELTVSRAAGGAPQTFVLASGQVVRFGSKPENDILADVDGCSRYHAEIFVNFFADDAGAADKPQVCIRSSARNGTGLRHQSEDKMDWKKLENGASKQIGAGWQVKMPWKSRSRITGKQATADERIFDFKVTDWIEGPPVAVRPPPPFARRSFAMPPPPPERPKEPPVAKAVATRSAATAVRTAAKARKPAFVSDLAAEKRKLERRMQKALESGVLPRPAAADGAVSAAPPAVAAPAVTATPASAIAASGVNRWRKKAVQAPNLAENDLYAAIDAEIGVPHAAAAPTAATASSAAPKLGPVPVPVVAVSADPPVRSAAPASRPKKRARASTTANGAGAVDEVCIDSSPEREAPPTARRKGVRRAAQPMIRLSSSTLAQHTNASGAAHRATNPAPPTAFDRDRGTLLGKSMLREISVSPISQPGVGRKKKRKKVVDSEASSDTRKKKKKSKPGLVASSARKMASSPRRSDATRKRHR